MNADDSDAEFVAAIHAARLAHDVINAYLEAQLTTRALGLPPGEKGANTTADGYYEGLAAATAVALSWTPGPDDDPALTLAKAIRARDRELGGRPERSADPEAQAAYREALKDVILTRETRTQRAAPEG